MSVLIKGMNMPEKCGLCPCFHAEYPMYCQAVKADKSKKVSAPYGLPRPEWCPLVEIPTPHGRLVDADALKKRGIDMDWSVQKWVSEVEIGTAPTVINAER